MAPPHSFSSPATRPYTLPILLFVLALVLRLWGITHESLWIDESATIRRAELSVGELLENCAVHGQLPFYFLLMHFWVAFAGTGELALRLPSALFGALNVVLAYVVLHRMSHENSFLPWSAKDGSRVFKSSSEDARKSSKTPVPLRFARYEMSWPLVGALLVATQPILIYFGQEARTYTLMLGLTWLILLSLVVPLHWQRPLLTFEVVLLSFCLSVLVLNHYIGWVIGLGCLMIYAWHLVTLKGKPEADREDAQVENPQVSNPKEEQAGEERKLGNLVDWNQPIRGPWVWLPLLAYLLPVVVWLLYMAHNGHWPNQDFHQGSSVLDTLTSWSEKKFAPALLLQVPLLIAIGLGMLGLDRVAPTTNRILILAILGLPLVVMLGGALTQNYFSARYFLPIMVPLLLLASRGLVGPGKGPYAGLEQRGPALLVIILILALAQTGWQSQAHLKPQWREAAEVIDENMAEGELVAVAPRWERETLNYYLSNSRAIKFEELQKELALEGSMGNLAGFWVVYRSDTDEQRQALHDELQGAYVPSRVDSVQSLQIWHYQAPSS